METRILLSTHDVGGGTAGVVRYIATRAMVGEQAEVTRVDPLGQHAVEGGAPLCVLRVGIRAHLEEGPGPCEPAVLNRMKQRRAPFDELLELGPALHEQPDRA